jgi:prepilin-type N-terminal cleavage/methylation domain-containing protein
VRGRAGFTLIELLVVVSIIGILASLATPRVRSAQYRARAVEVVNAMRAVRIGAISYYDSAGAWPPSAGFGSMPSELEGYIGPNIPFTGTGWEMRWQPQGTRRGRGTGRIRVRTTDPYLCSPLGNLLGGPTSDLTVVCGGRRGTITQTFNP